MVKIRRELNFADGWSLVLFIWGLFDFFVLLFFSFSNTIFVLYVVFVVCFWLGLYILEPKWYYITIFFLVLVEETLAFYSGGGLQGSARSLLHDYVRSIPLFMTHAFLWRQYMKKYAFDERDIYLMAGLHGFFWEIALPGHILDVLSVFLIGGSAIMIYGLLVLIPKTLAGRRSITVQRKILLWIEYLCIEIMIGFVFAILFP